MSDLPGVIAALNPTFGASTATIAGGQSFAALQAAYATAQSSGITGQLSILGNFQPPPPDIYNAIFVSGWRPTRAKGS
jgi:hypothetical protein